MPGDDMSVDVPDEVVSVGGYLAGDVWQMIGSLLVTIMLLLSIAYLIKVMAGQAR